MTTRTLQRPPVSAAFPRIGKASLDGAWVATGLTVALFVVGLEMLGIVPGHLGGRLGSLVGCALMYAALSAWLMAGSTPSTLWWRASTLHVSAMLLVSVQWVQAGGASVPAFAFLLLLPVASTVAVRLRWLPWVAAGSAMGLTCVVAFVTSAEVRWWLRAQGIPLPEGLETVAWAGSLFDGRVGSTTPSELAVIGTLFALSTLCVAFLATGAIERLTEAERDVVRERSAAAGLRSLSDGLVRGTPLPTAVVATGDGRILRAGDSFAERVGVEDPDGVVDETIGAVLDFALPEHLDQVLAGNRVIRAPITAGGTNSVVRIAPWPVRVDDVDAWAIVLQERTLVHGLIQALDGDPAMLALLDQDMRVVWLNTLARERFGEGADRLAEDVFDQEGLVAGWWSPGPRETTERSVQVDGVTYALSVRRVRIPGTPWRWFWLKASRKEGGGG